MASKDARRAKKRARKIELLEERRVMTADLLNSLAPPPLEHHSLFDVPIFQHGGFAEEAYAGAIEQHNFADPPLQQHVLVDSGDMPLDQHVESRADFWIDSTTERDFDALAGDIEQTLSSAHGATGLTQVRNNYGFIGAGQTVAVIDSGIAYDHSALGAGYGASYRVVGGWDFTEENDANPYDDGWAGSHGTHVAGIVGADRTGTADDGVAPGVDLVGLRVFNDIGEGYFSWVENALRWVHQNRNAFENPITAVNLSLGTSWNSESIPAWTTMEDEFAQLEADGIFITVSAGNSFATYNAPGLSYPAASPYVVPVMSVGDNGQLSSFSQRSTRAIAAPGAFITSTVPDYAGNHNGIADDYASFSGTSMAAPYIAGASVLLREAMQFVGYTNITQDTIFNHMMSTATSFFDTATNQTYKRINLTSAFDALMPTDEYGSTIATAFDLGSLSGSSEISGLIGKLSDADYFRFTAAATGSVSFTVGTTHTLAPVWNATGGAVSGVHGETYTFQVVAGQSYTVGVSTSGGIGYYDLSIDAQSSFTFVDWSTITQQQFNNIANASEAWYRVRTSQSGYLSAEAFFASAGGNVDLKICNASQQVVATGVANGSGERVDFYATGGTDYYLCVTGANSDIDFKLTNLVSASGTTILVAGTSAADAFSFAAGAVQHSISVNGTAYQVNKAATSTVNFAGAAGADTITFTGTSGDETATLRVGNASLSGSGFSATASAIENVTVNSGGGAGDIAYLYDTTGNDTLRAWGDRAELSGTGYLTQAVAFARVDGIASGGTDIAYLNDTTGDDLLRTYSDRSIMSGTGYLNRAIGFDRADGIASGGNDTAQMYDSTGNDAFEAYSDHATMAGVTYLARAYGFEQVDGYASTGTDSAKLFDTAGNEVFNSYSDRATMSGSGFLNRAFGFDQTEGLATSGSDVASLFDSTGNDTFTAWTDHASMTIAGGAVFTATGFDRFDGFASTGNDIATLYDSAGDDTFRGYLDRATMSGASFSNRAFGFDRADGQASTGYDFATLYDSAGNDTFTSYSDRATMAGTGYLNRALAFDRVDGFASAGNDLALLYDSLGDDVFETFPTRATMTGNGFLNRALYFTLSQAYYSGGNDTVKLNGSTGNDFYDAWADRVEFRGAGFRHQAYGFKNTTAYGKGGADTANLYDSIGNDQVRARDWGAYIVCGSWRNTAYDFDDVIARSVNGGNDTSSVDAVDYLFSLVGNWH